MSSPPPRRTVDVRTSSPLLPLRLLPFFSGQCHGLLRLSSFLLSVAVSSFFLWLPPSLPSVGSFRLLPSHFARGKKEEEGKEPSSSSLLGSKKEEDDSWFTVVIWVGGRAWSSAWWIMLQILSLCCPFQHRDPLLTLLSAMSVFNCPSVSHRTLPLFPSSLRPAPSIQPSVHLSILASTIALMGRPVCATCAAPLAPSCTPCTCSFTHPPWRLLPCPTW